MARPTQPFEGQSGLNRIEAGFGQGSLNRNKTRFIFRIPFYQGNSHVIRPDVIGTTNSYMTTTMRLDLGSTGVGFRHEFARVIPTNFRVFVEGADGYGIEAKAWKGTTEIASVSRGAMVQLLEGFKDQVLGFIPIANHPVQHFTQLFPMLLEELFEVRHFMLIPSNLSLFF